MNQALSPVHVAKVADVEYVHAWSKKVNAKHRFYTPSPAFTVRHLFHHQLMVHCKPLSSLRVRGITIEHPIHATPMRKSPCRISVQCTNSVVSNMLIRLHQPSLMQASLYRVGRFGAQARLHPVRIFFVKKIKTNSKNFNFFVR